MIFVRGADSEIAKALDKLSEVYPVERGDPMPQDGEKYLFCVGLLRQARLVDQSYAEASESFFVNCVQIMRECDRLIEFNHRARICVVGSESAFKWSFDGVYAAAKAALHRYVETKQLKFREQQLVCVAPSNITHTIARRNDAGRAALEARRLKHPKQRWLEPMEVAEMINFLLNVDKGYTTGVVIRMNGGEHCAT